ncbi:hypothetical protein BGW37DRAFT_480083 [Umbelopsis sp. PMI_123]|jgi:hypothetical protein|nr:hypothetical protein BGW37DRAFT_480083 [Umbelopsis sp. PMI_123]
MSNPQQQNNHAFQAGFAKAKDEFEAGYKAAIGSHHQGGPVAPGQQQTGFDQQQEPAFDRQQQPAFDQQQQAGYGQQQMANPATGNVQQPGVAGQTGMTSDVQSNAYQQHMQDLNQDPGAGGATGVRQQAYDEHKRNLDQNPYAGDTNMDSMTGGPGAGISGGNFNTQLDQEANTHSGPPHGLGNKIKSKLPHHFNDGTKIPRELREDVRGQTGPGPM